MFSVYCVRSVKSLSPEIFFTANSSSRASQRNWPPGDFFADQFHRHKEQTPFQLRSYSKYTANVIQIESPYWPKMWQCGIKVYCCCAAGNSQRGPPKPESAESSAPGEDYPQKWCTTLWVNEQNMMYDRGGSKRKALKRQPVVALCLAHYRTECRVFFMLRIYCSP